MPRLTLQSLIDRVYDKVDGNALLYPEVELIAAINEGVRVTNLFVGFQQISAEIPYYTQKNRIWYDTPNGMVFPLRVQFENRYLEPTSIEALGRRSPQWTTETTTNTLSAVSSWIRFGFKRFGIHPADGVGGRMLLVTGIAEPIPLVNPTDTIVFSNDQMAAFDLYAAHLLTLKESSQQFASNSSEYQDFLRLIKKLTIWKTTFVAPRYFISEASQPTNK